MCEPTTIAAIAIGVAGTYSAYTQYETGKYNQKVAEVEAKNADNQAQYAKRIGAIEEERHRIRVRQMIGAQRARAAANGVDISSGSALDLQASTARFGAEDANTIRANSMREAWGFNTQATSLRAKGRLARYEGNTGAVGTLLTTGSRAYGVYNGI